MTKTLAIMQPYLFPYLGYFQLVSKVDEFVFYDDVQFIKQGWINRNKVWVNQAPHLFSIPIRCLSSNRLIAETEVDKRQFNIWKSKFLKTLEQSYRSSIYMDVVHTVLDQTWAQQPSISEMAATSVVLCSELLGLNPTFKSSSKHYPRSTLTGQERLLSICHASRSTEYINPIGGKELYSRKAFSNKGVRLRLLESEKSLFSDPHKGLSILHLLLEWGPKQTKELLSKCRII